MAQRWSWLLLYSAYRKASRKFLAVITAGTSPRSAGSQAGMTTGTLLPNGGHVTRCEAVWAKREGDGPAAPPVPAGFAPSGWKVAGSAEPHATTSAPTPASKALRGPRHIRHPPPSPPRTGRDSTNGDPAVYRGQRSWPGQRGNLPGRRLSPSRQRGTSGRQRGTYRAGAGTRPAVLAPSALRSWQSRWLRAQRLSLCHGK